MFDLPLCTHTDTEGNRERPESGIYFKILEIKTIFNEHPVDGGCAFLKRINKGLSFPIFHSFPIFSIVLGITCCCVRKKTGDPIGWRIGHTEGMVLTDTIKGGFQGCVQVGRFLTSYCGSIAEIYNFRTNKHEKRLTLNKFLYPPLDTIDTYVV